MTQNTATTTHTPTLTPTLTQGQYPKFVTDARIKWGDAVAGLSGFSTLESVLAAIKPMLRASDAQSVITQFEGLAKVIEVDPKEQLLLIPSAGYFAGPTGKTKFCPARQVFSAWLLIQLSKAAIVSGYTKRVNVYGPPADKPTKSVLYGEYQGPTSITVEEACEISERQIKLSWEMAGITR